MTEHHSLSAIRPTWHHPRILLLLLTVFLCGMAAGAFTARLVSQRASQPAWAVGGKQLTIEMLAKELDLSPEQAIQIETVLDEFVLYYQNLQGQMDDFRADGKHRIMSVLNTEQRAKFERMMSSLSAKLR